MGEVSRTQRKGFFNPLTLLYPQQVYVAALWLHQGVLSVVQSVLLFLLPHFLVFSPQFVEEGTFHRSCPLISSWTFFTHVSFPCQTRWDDKRSLAQGHQILRIKALVFYIDFTEVHFLLACDAFFSLKFVSVHSENSSLEKEANLPSLISKEKEQLM